MPAPSPAIAAVVYAPGQPVEALLRDFAAELAAAGVRLGGLLQRTVPGPDHCKCRMEVVELDSGRHLSISQDLGSGSSSCSLDPSALAEASGAVRRAVEARVELVMVNKYGKAEQSGGGLAAEMLQAMSEGVPLLTTVPAALVDDWRAFTGDAGALLAPEAAALRAWWQSGVG
ncbi:DUF2478 domain-containing protein [Magnetospirillum sp. UT-4]|uniref:DUF2478 domain-containing protein n=1 Tax=Magnetospirillum sp. UT-4 TaxID=2681467 RepID=UPI00138282D0|nr:DUF2478 domain-containing protein [Magnetospirillum sp. UT-4]CAA7612090.1 conserved hypothetical protein [Magnetospirillum sp. UT-4]